MGRHADTRGAWRMAFDRWQRHEGHGEQCERLAPKLRQPCRGFSVKKRAFPAQRHFQFKKRKRDRGCSRTDPSTWATRGCLHHGRFALPKKTLGDIIQTQNDYVVGVKANQPTLLTTIEAASKTQKPKDTYIQTEKTRDRQTTRSVSVYEAPENLRQNWPGLANFVQVNRTGFRKGKPCEETNYYISSLDISAERFAEGIRQHWNIENRLHWVKDVDFGEDKSKIRTGNAPSVMSLIRNIVINIFRENGYTSIAVGKRMIAHDFLNMWNLF